MLIQAAAKNILSQQKFFNNHVCVWTYTSHFKGEHITAFSQGSSLKGMNSAK